MFNGDSFSWRRQEVLEMDHHSASENELNATELYIQQWLKWGFPGGAVVESPPADARRGHGFLPRSGKIPHATEWLGP